jgi:hypothetical protein
MNKKRSSLNIKTSVAAHKISTAPHITEPFVHHKISSVEHIIDYEAMTSRFVIWAKP